MQENVGSKYHPHLAATAALEAIKIGIEKVGTTGMETLWNYRNGNFCDFPFLVRTMLSGGPQQDSHQGVCMSKDEELHMMGQVCGLWVRGRPGGQGVHGQAAAVDLRKG